jgi:hypothetical protein
MNKFDAFAAKAKILGEMLETVGKLRDSDLEKLVAPMEGMTVWSYDDVETLTASINHLFEEILMLQEELQSFTTPPAGSGG